jgi:glycosyltransferase involved in cell wall biosynthesis
LAKSAPQAFVLNRGLAEARFETVLFLDDDNAYLPGGVAQLAQAVARGGFDIAVTALEIFDDTQVGPAPTTGRLIFLGEAHSAGLFFNAFGDTAMAVHRDAFLNFGGFHEPGYDYPSLDWVTLAKAQAAGLRIGALQWPAVRYRRDIGRADLAANKLDQEGARSFVFEAYGGVFDGELLARYAQKLHLEEI